jgi:hypothetical protein
MYENLVKIEKQYDKDNGKFLDVTKDDSRVNMLGTLLKNEYH